MGSLGMIPGPLCDFQEQSRECFEMVHSALLGGDYGNPRDDTRANQ